MLLRSLTILSALALAIAPLTGVLAQNGGDRANLETDVVTFYGHVFGHTLDQPMPANTEAPIGESNYGLGSFHWCTEQVTATNEPDVYADTGCRDHRWNTLGLFSTAGFVDVQDRSEFQQNGDYAQLHNERGQTKDVLLDTSQSITARLFMSVDVHAWTVGAGETNCPLPHPEDVPCVYPYWGWDPGAQPDYVVQATLYSANLGAHGANASDAPPLNDAITSGDATLIAQGQWGPEQVTTGLPGSPQAQEFNIDLGPPQTDTIPRDEDFFLVYRFYSETAGQAYSAHTWRVWSGEFFPPSFTMPVKNAFDVERVIPTFAHGKLAILGVMNTPWGSYDIDDESIDLEIQGPQGKINPESISRFGDVSFAHGGHYLPINVTWIWDYQKDNVPTGDYEVTVSASNFQGSAQAECTATFTLQRAGDGALTASNIEEGVCGLQSASDEFLEGLESGATTDQGGS